MKNDTPVESERLIELRKTKAQFSDEVADLDISSALDVSLRRAREAAEKLHFVRGRQTQEPAASHR